MVALLVVGCARAPARGAFEERAALVGPWRLPATLTVPAGAAGAPAVVLVGGSGPLDRDGTVGGCKPLRDLAHGLGARGIAVLRYDKRTRVHGGALRGDARTVREEVIDDALAAAALVRATRGVDPRRVFVLGHSLGGTLVPRIGAGDPALRGLIVMAGSTRPLEDLLVEQLAYVSGLDGAVSDEEAALLERLRAQAARVKALGSQPAPPADALPLGLGAAYWLDLAAHPAPELAARDRRPLLVLHADRDYQVRLADFEGWRRSRPDATLKRYAALNHLFVAGTGPSTPLEYQRPARLAPEVVEDIAAWIHAH